MVKRPLGGRERTMLRPWREYFPKIHTFTKVERWGLVDPPLETGGATREFGYGLYVNAYVQDHDFYSPSDGLDGKMGAYATERVPFDADQARISKARKLARDRARQRYLREKATI